jgi:serine/threonine-protein kinase
MGEVYKAFDPTLQRIVAVKTVRPDIDRPDFLERLYREAQACARLQHPNIVTVFEAGEFNRVVYIAMEYLKGDSLHAVLRRGDLTFDGKLRILIQILDALQHAHSEDVIHRDIKPSNVNRQPDGSIKLLDFGLARMTRAETMTLSGAVMGTPHYASPEQLKGERVDHRTDIYSTGALAYEMFAGRRPFQADNDSVATIVFKVISEQPAPIDTMWSKRFPEIEQIITKAMAKLPADRYQSAAEMRDALTAFRETSRDTITAVQTESQLAAQQTVVAAKGLMAAGASAQAQALLSDALRDDPDANDVRTMLDETRTPAPAPPSRAGSFGAPMPTPDIGGGYVAPAPMGSEYRTHSLGTALIPPPRMPRALWWAAGGAAVLAVASGVMLMQGQRFGSGAQTAQVVEPAPSIASGSRPAEPPAPSGEGERAAAATTPPMAAVPSPNANVAARSAAPAASAGAMGTGATATPPAGPPTAPSLPPAAALAPAPATVPVLTAKQMYSASAGGTANTGLKYRLIQQLPSGTEVDVDPSTTFRSGDRVRFAFESNIDGYLYVMQLGSTGRGTLLFPDPEINGGRNTIKRGQEFMVPNDYWFAFDNNPGVEQIFVVLSKELLTELPGFKAPVTTSQTPVQALAVNSVQQQIRSRDLVLEKDRPTPGATKPSQATYVVNKTEVGKAVATTIQLTHGK